MLAALTGWTTSRWLASVATVLLVVQLVVTISPSPGAPRYKSDAAMYQMISWRNPTTQRQLWLNPGTVMLRHDAWDWSPLRELCRKYRYPHPKIAYLGNIDRINFPSITFPWIQLGEDVKATQLWHTDSGVPIDWDNAMAAIDKSNVVISQVVPENWQSNSVEALDSQYNNELIKRLRSNSQFSDPIELTMGKFEPTPIVVFFRIPKKATPNT
jgi:hypothetical protein